MRPSRRWLAGFFLAVAGCFPSLGDGEPPPADASPPNVPGCITAETRATERVPVVGQVVDFVTGDPVAGVTVDITTAWDVEGYVPRAECPLLARATTDDTGQFGPLTVSAGSTEQPPILLFLVHGGDRANTSLDARAPCPIGEDCRRLEVTIPAASAELDATWRAELAAGGMADAATRSLVAFRYKNTDQTGAAGVVPNEGLGTPRTLVPNIEVRFLAADRATLTARGETDTTASGIALIGRDTGTGRVDIGGVRGATEQWHRLGCLLSSGFTFFEDETVAP
jgi:hypothetical protein